MCVKNSVHGGEYLGRYTPLGRYVNPSGRYTPGRYIPPEGTVMG